MADKYDHETIEKKWRSIWYEQGINESERDEDKKKFFLIFAYPGISGFLHVGHMRGFTYAEVITRYKRMRGYNVLFPAGFHATGLPAVSLAKRVDRRDAKTIDYLRRNGTPEQVIDKLSDPNYAVEYFSKVYKENYWKMFGFLIDFSRSMTTIDQGYKRFIGWQFKKLKEKGLLTTKPHFAPYCPNCGPVAVDASETDVQKGGSAEAMEFTVIKFKLPSGEILPAATLRPETVYGVTNMWLNPSVEYIRVKYKDEIWIMSGEAVEKLEYQRKEGEIDLLDKVEGKDIIGQEVEVPFTGRKALVLPSTFVDPGIATGVVMSVPAHAPFDWIALHDLKTDGKYRKMLQDYEIDRGIVDAIEPIGLIRNSARGDDPAGAIVTEMGIETQDDPKLEEATKEIYKEEYHSGILNFNTQEYEGERVSEVKDQVIDDLNRGGFGDRFMEFSEPVLCRCGSPVVIKLIPNQWFIRYTEPELTRESKEHVDRMDIIPLEYKESLPDILDWFGDRACIRTGSWLGTPFPFKENWVIEPISDSTLYPAYYIISKYVNSGELEPQDMDDKFFDYVFGLSAEKPGVEMAQRIRKDFEYWYPLDINLGGKEHMTVHFPVFLMNHVAVMPPEYRPRGIFVHWWITQRGGEKIAKSKGGAEPIPNAILDYGVDTLRLYYCHVSGANMDVEWDVGEVLNYKKKLARLFSWYSRLINIETRDPGEENEMDDWLSSRIKANYDGYIAAMDDFDLRSGANKIFYTFVQDIKWYLRRVEVPGPVIREALALGIKAMTPFTPFIAEELHEKTKREDTLVSCDRIEINDRQRDIKIEGMEKGLQSLLEDIKEIRKATGIDPEKAYLYIADHWKYEVTAAIAKLVKREGKGGMDFGKVMKKVMSLEKAREHKKSVPGFVKSVIKDLMKLDDNILTILEEAGQGSEYDYLSKAKGFLAKELGSEIEIYLESEPDRYDPKGRGKTAQPLKPAVYLE